MLTTDPVLSLGPMAEAPQARADLTPEARAFTFLVEGEEGPLFLAGRQHRLLTARGVLGLPLSVRFGASQRPVGRR
ncbi:MAG: hypothetical protein ACRC33_02115 [Gemmataceae bacterium]